MRSTGFKCSYASGFTLCGHASEHSANDSTSHKLGVDMVPVKGEFSGPWLFRMEGGGIARGHGCSRVSFTAGGMELAVIVLDTLAELAPAKLF